MRRRATTLADDVGSSPVEFILVGGLLTLLTLAVLQLAIAVYVRNVVHDAAVDGAYEAALADRQIDDGVEAARMIISRTLGAAYAENVRAERTIAATGEAVVELTVRAHVPLIGLIGVPGSMEVTARAPVETLE